MRRARGAADLELVYEVRWRGYRKYFNDPAEVREPLDVAPNAILLLAVDAEGNAIGTLRVLDRRFGPIELDNYVDVERLLPAHRHPVADGSRLSVPPSQGSFQVKVALWKAYFRYCRDAGVRTMIASVRPGAARDYRALLFEHLGEAGVYQYTRLGNKRHETWALDVPSAKARYRAHEQPLYRFFHEEEHANISHE